MSFLFFWSITTMAVQCHWKAIAMALRWPCNGFIIMRPLHMHNLHYISLLGTWHADFLYTHKFRLLTLLAWNFKKIVLTQHVHVLADVPCPTLLLLVHCLTRETTLSKVDIFSIVHAFFLLPSLNNWKRIKTVARIISSECLKSVSTVPCRAFSLDFSKNTLHTGRRGFSLFHLFIVFPPSEEHNFSPIGIGKGKTQSSQSWIRIRSIRSES